MLIIKLWRVFPNYGLRAKCDPSSIFNWPVSKTKNIGHYGLYIIQVVALKAGFTLHNFLEWVRH